jgi:hypothetical protein
MEASECASWGAEADAEIGARLCWSAKKSFAMMRSMVVRRKKPRSASTKPRRGRPVILDENWSKVSVVLFNRQIVRLDRLANDIRNKTGHIINRAALIRALIDGVLDSGFEMRTVISEENLRALLAAQLRAS